MNMLLFVVVGFFLGLILGLVAAILSVVYKTENFILVFVIAIILSVVVGMIVSYNHSSDVSEEYVLDETIELVALGDSFSATGSFFLGIGHIENEAYYFFYYVTPEGGRALDKVLASSTIVFEEERENATLEKYIIHIEYEGKWRLNWLDFPFDINKDLEWDTEYKIYVPKGTIVNDFNLDLE